MTRKEKGRSELAWRGVIIHARESNRILRCCCVFASFTHTARQWATNDFILYEQIVMGIKWRMASVTRAVQRTESCLYSSTRAALNLATFIPLGAGHHHDDLQQSCKHGRAINLARIVRSLSFFLPPGSFWYTLKYMYTGICILGSICTGHTGTSSEGFAQIGVVQRTACCTLLVHYTRHTYKKLKTQQLWDRGFRRNSSYILLPVYGQHVVGSSGNNENARGKKYHSPGKKETRNA